MQIRRCRAAGDEETARVLEIIHADEITHVAAGTRFCPPPFLLRLRLPNVVRSLRAVTNNVESSNCAGHRHFTALCASLEPEPIDPVAQFRLEVSRHFWGHVRGPFNVEDRDRAGIGRDWYENLGGRGTVKKEEV